MRSRRTCALAYWVIVLSVFAFSVAGKCGYAQALTQQQADEIALEAYLYFYPLVLMDLTRLQMTNIEAGKIDGRGPMNKFVHLRTFPKAGFKEVVRPNFDTLYSLAWLDLTKEPMIISVPDMGDRYYMLPLLDMWTDVFDVIGTRTTGNKAGSFAIIPRGWKGSLPDGVQPIESPTPYVWIIGRTQTNGPKDYAAVNKVQDSYKLVPLSQFGKEPKPTKVQIDPKVDMKTPPMELTNKMKGGAFFTYAAELMKVQPPHIVDQPIVARLKRLGMEPGKSFDLTKADPMVRKALEGAPAKGLKAMETFQPKLAPIVNGWQISTNTMGVYGTFYLKRAVIAMVGLGANLPEDAIYPLAFTDSQNKPLDGADKYILHFDKKKLPPVDAFWSVTLYDNEGYPVANKLNRFALGDRDPVKFKPDGSLDLYVQAENPGKEKEANWLPAPKGPFNLTMRLYDPRPSVLNGSWAPPPVKRVD